MNVSSLEFFILEAFRGLRRSGLLAGVAVGIVTVSLWIFGAFLLVTMNINNLVHSVGSRLEISAYANDAVTLQEASEVQIALSKIHHVSSVSFVSRGEAWEKFQGEFGGRLALGEAFRNNPLPDTFMVQVSAPEHMETVARAVAQHNKIDEVRYSNQMVEQLTRLSDLVQLGGAALVLLFGFATLLIVVNTIRLTVIAREADISIMRLVGATRSFIQWPFVLEGLILGLFGGGAAVFLLRLGYQFLLGKAGETLPFLPLLRNPTELVMIYLVVMLSAILLTTAGAYFSVRRTLEREA